MSSGLHAVRAVSARTTWSIQPSARPLRERFAIRRATLRERFAMLARDRRAGDATVEPRPAL